MAPLSYPEALEWGSPAPSSSAAADRWTKGTVPLAKQIAPLNRYKEMSSALFRMEDVPHVPRSPPLLVPGRRGPSRRRGTSWGHGLPQVGAEMCLDSGGGGAGRPCRARMGEMRPRDRRRGTGLLPGEEGEEGAAPGTGGRGGVPAQCPVNGQARGCMWAGRSPGGGGNTCVWVTGPGCHGDTPHRQAFSATPGSRPCGDQPLGALEAKVTGHWDRGGFPLLCGLQAVNSRRGLGRESGEKGVVEAGKGHWPSEREAGARWRRQGWGRGGGDPGGGGREGDIIPS